MSEVERTTNLLSATALAVSDQLLDTVVETVGCGVSAPAALVTLLAEFGIGVTELGARIGLSQPAAARLVAALVSQGLVERRPGHNGRTVALYLTEHGRELAHKALAARKRVVSELVTQLDSEEREALTHVLEKLLTQLLDDDGRPFVLCRLCNRGMCTAEGAVCPVGAAARARGVYAG